MKMNDQIDSGDFETFEDFILTHPELDKNEFSKNYVDERVSVKEIVEMFRDERLKKIPKIFFIQVQQFIYIYHQIHDFCSKEDKINRINPLS